MRVEHEGDINPARIALLVDVGDSDPEPFLLTDSENPDRPREDLTPLLPEDFLALSTDRIPDLMLSQGAVRDLQAVVCDVAVDVRPRLQIDAAGADRSFESAGNQPVAECRPPSG